MKQFKSAKKGEWFEIVVPPQWNSWTIEKLLKENWQVPKGLLHQWRMDKSVKVNGETLHWNSVLEENYRLQIHLFKEEEYGVRPEPLPIEPIFEDEHLLIVNKPANMDTHPNQAGQGGTIANAVAFHWQSQGLSAKVRHIHRLDRDTTGGVVFAKHALSGAILDRMLTSRAIKRTYAAFAHGLLKQKKGTVNAPIGRDRHHSTRRRVSDRGDEAITHYQLLKLYGHHRISQLELQLETGRTHQIRVHMSHIGHPLLGDTLYGGQSNLFPRQALHAARIQLPHPLTSEALDLTIPWPIDLQRLQESLN
ncbi:RluA family pseudouridine synthase [Ammoniphilus sp. 3BR4]|uniref:RluA family pseudouridine synthase n=1 Tax=Ammoniphilus sp. 3BR4 TaxID=3158265 RepID=UPI0034663DC0